MAAKKHEHLLKAMTDTDMEPWENRGLEAGIHPDMESRGRQTPAQANSKAKLMSGGAGLILNPREGIEKDGSRELI